MGTYFCTVTHVENVENDENEIILDYVR
ncbi:hypothetical protein [Plasmodium yoelii yoelii]|uniref:Uncharacterized protein n=1 Tax=Plasmodium yoelii yoelii TaxID=73239 RepID=Q7RQ41_PLAYO|nr:hypothetical protein [Plasmodium yoelii yoelii]